MKVVAEFFGRCHVRYQPGLDGRGLNRGNANPLETFDLLEPSYQIQKSPTLLLVTADIDSGEHDFLMATINELARLPANVFELAAPFPSPGEGNDAEGAKKIAPVLNLQVGPGRVVLARAVDLEIRLVDEIRVKHDGLRQFPRAVNKVGNFILYSVPTIMSTPGISRSASKPIWA